MHISLDSTSAKPLYLQLREALRGRILAGELPGGARMPASRMLAAQLHVSRGTVDAAYQGLIEDGLCRIQRGVGIFVSLDCPKAESQSPAVDWAARITPSAKRAQSLHIGKKVDLSARDTISFTSLAPDQRLFEVELFRRCLNDALAREGGLLLGYGYTRGYTPLITQIAEYQQSKGISCQGRTNLIVNGFRQGLGLVTHMLVNEGDTVLVESPCYNGALALFQTVGARVVHVPCDAQGMRIDALEALLAQHKPSLIYTVPTYNNPTGRNMPVERRRQFLDVTARAGVPIVEDGFNEELRYRGEMHPALAALDARSQVIYIGSFSKVLFPGLRIGWILAPEPLGETLLAGKYHEDIHTPLLSQAGLAEFLKRGGLERHLAYCRKEYRERLDAMHAALHQHLRGKARWEVCEGGFSVWLELAESADARALLPKARAAGVSYAPGDVFFADEGQGRNALRLGFPRLNPEEIREGVKRLAAVLPPLE